MIEGATVGTIIGGILGAVAGDARALVVGMVVVGGFGALIGANKPKRKRVFYALRDLLA